ncbi:MAG: hypothetical protein ACOYB3_07750 [Azonexus sp.]
MPDFDFSTDDYFAFEDHYLNALDLPAGAFARFLGAETLTARETDLLMTGYVIQWTNGHALEQCLEEFYETDGPANMTDREHQLHEVASIAADAALAGRVEDRRRLGS